MKILMVSLTRQITLLSGRYMELLERDGELIEGPNGITLITADRARLIPWHSIDSVEYARGSE